MHAGNWRSGFMQISSDCLVYARQFISKESVESRRQRLTLVTVLNWALITRWSTKKTSSGPTWPENSKDCSFLLGSLSNAFQSRRVVDSASGMRTVSGTCIGSGRRHALSILCYGRRHEEFEVVNGPSIIFIPDF